MESLQSWDWIFGKTPRFRATFPTYSLANLHLDIEKGKVVDLTCDQPFDEPCLERLRDTLLNSDLRLVTFRNLAENLQRCRVIYEPHFDTSAMIHVMQHLCATNV